MPFNQKWISYGTKLSINWSFWCFSGLQIGLNGTKQWRYYDFGPKSVAPLVCLSGTAGTADVFYKQILTLALKVTFNNHLLQSLIFFLTSILFQPCQTNACDSFLTRVGRSHCFAKCNSWISSGLVCSSFIRRDRGFALNWLVNPSSWYGQNQTNLQCLSNSFSCMSKFHVMFLISLHICRASIKGNWLMTGLQDNCCWCSSSVDPSGMGFIFWEVPGCSWCSPCKCFKLEGPWPLKF